MSCNERGTDMGVIRDRSPQTPEQQWCARYLNLLSAWSRNNQNYNFLWQMLWFTGMTNVDWSVAVEEWRLRSDPSPLHPAEPDKPTAQWLCASVWCQWCASFRNVAPNWSECVLFHCMKLPPSFYQPVSLSCVPFASHFKPPLLFYCPCLFVNTLRFSYTLHFSSWVLRAHRRLQWRCVEKCFGEKSRVKLWCYSV